MSEEKPYIRKITLAPYILIPPFVLLAAGYFLYATQAVILSAFCVFILKWDVFLKQKLRTHLIQSLILGIIGFGLLTWLDHGLVFIIYNVTVVIAMAVKCIGLIRHANGGRLFG